MTRYEAHIEKAWRESGLARVVVFRIRDDWAEAGVFLVDVWCLGMKDAYLVPDLPAAELEEFLAEHFGADAREVIHPACAKKLVEGAIAYAEGFGFAPARDYRKARRVLSGIDAALCPMEFTFGRDGRPCYVAGADAPERVDRVLAALEAHCGLEGFDYEPAPEDEEEGNDIEAVRQSLIGWLGDEPVEVPRFYALSGMVTALHVCPVAVPPARLLDALWPDGPPWADESERDDFVELLAEYWEYIGDSVFDCFDPAVEQPIPVDIVEDDFPEEDGISFVAATVEWTQGFVRTTELWPEAWRDAVNRPDLASHWEILRWWVDFLTPESRDRIAAAAEGKPSRTLVSSVVALVRALRRDNAEPREFAE